MLPTDCQYSTLDAHTLINDGVAQDILVLSHKNNAAITIFSNRSADSTWEDFTLKIDDTKIIRDLNIVGQYLTVLLEKNEVQVIDLVLRTVIFKATYKDANGKVTRVFYIDLNKRFLKNGALPSD